MPRRRPGTLLALEVEILEAALAHQRSGQETFHGFGLASELRRQGGSRSLTAHGTLYKALGRLERQGLLASGWEDGDAVEGRPRRRLYRLTPEGGLALARAVEEAPEPSRPSRANATRGISGSTA